MNNNFKRKLGSLVIFRNLLKLQIIKNLIELDSITEDDVDCKIYAYGEFLSSLLAEGKNLSRYILEAVLED